MKRSIKVKIHRAILFALNYSAFFINMAAVCALDSESWLPFIAWVVSGCWLLLSAWANGWFYTGNANATDGKWFK